MAGPKLPPPGGIVPPGPKTKPPTPPAGYGVDTGRKGGVRPWDKKGFDPTHGGPFYKPNPVSKGQPPLPPPKPAPKPRPQPKPHPVVPNFANPRGYGIGNASHSVNGKPGVKRKVGR
jgi:hypothetical protein